MANDIRKFPIPLIFKKILKDKMSGVLMVTHGELSKELSFIDGELVCAKTSLMHERLGEILLAQGKITRVQLQNAIKIKKSSSTSRRIGEILVEVSNLDMKDLYPALLLQAKTIATSAFSLQDGQWRFIVDDDEIGARQLFHIKLPELILLGVNRIADISFFKRRYMYHAPVTLMLPESVKKILSPDQTHFYDRLPAFSQTPTEQVVSQMKEIKGNEDISWRTIIFFYLVNVLDFVEFTVDEERNQNIEELNELYDRVGADGTQVDYYQLLGVKPDTEDREIKKIYFEYSQKYHPDRINASPDSTIMLKANAVLAEINAAYSVLGNPNKRREYDKERSQVSGMQSKREEGVKRARKWYVKANFLYKQNRFHEAASLLEKAVNADETKANYFLLLGICQSKMEETRRQAELHLKKASEMEPWNADPVFALGELYRVEKLSKNADACFKKALEMNMEHALDGKAAKDIRRVMKGKKSILSLFGKRKKI
jgi:curved DNA-binding protein CbpA